MRYLFITAAIVILSVTSCAPPAISPLTRNISATKAVNLLKTTPNIVILDIRTPGEFEKGHIEGAQNIDFMGDEFETKISSLEKDAPYLMHCASGGRSGRAIEKFNTAGFQSILHLNEGYKGWVAAGNPVTK